MLGTAIDTRRLPTAECAGREPSVFSPRTDENRTTLRSERASGAPAPAVSIVVPVPPSGPAPVACGCLVDSALPVAPFELLVARGRSPSAQRNAAVGTARGKYVLFLDDDSEPAPGLVDLYRSVLESDSSIAAVGGPAVPRPAGIFQRVTALLLGEPLVMGRSASRYRQVGEVRPTDERELILCNMAVRRDVFLALGGFDERLFPNEENEFLERLTHAGYRAVYHPQAVVHRPQWQTVGGLLRKVFSYGRGRAAQVRRGGSHVSAMRVALALAFVGALPALATQASAAALVPAFAYALYLLVLGTRLFVRGGLAAAVLGPFLALLIHAAYGPGVLTGLLRPARRALSAVTLERMRGPR